MLHGLAGDCRLALRSLRRAPAVSLAALLTLTLGIGATTAIFSVANGLVLRPLPLDNPHDLVTITSETALRHGFHAGAGWSYAMWDRLRQRADAFDGAFAWTRQRLDLSEGGEMQPANGLVASGDVFGTLRVAALIGRTFTAADDTTGGDGPIVVISYALWQRRFGGRSDVLRARLLVDGTPVTIVGVMPEWFHGVDVGQPFDVAMPFATEALVHPGRSVIGSPRTYSLTVMLRLKPGQGLAQAAATLRSMQPHIVGAKAPALLEEPFVVLDASRGISDRSGLRQRCQYPLVILSIISAIVLVIVCLNIANLLLSRASGRRPELGVRRALGAPRWRLAREHFVEAVLLGAAGTAGGVLLGVWISRALVAQLPGSDAGIAIGPAIDWRVLAFAAGAALIAVVLFGTMPAVYATRVDPREALGDAGRGAAGARTGALTAGLLVTQVALSIVLLAGAGLFVTSMKRLVSVPLGFEPRDVVIVSVNTSRSALEKDEPLRLRQRILDAVAAVPGVAHASGSVWAPVGTGAGGLLSDAQGRRAGDARRVAFNFVTPGWVETYRTAVRAGRDFNAADGPGAPRVALINESLGRSLLRDAQPLGSTIQAGPCGREGCTVVGVVADAVYGQSLRDAAPPTVYLPFAQSAGRGPANAPFRVSLRASGDLTGVMRSVAAALRGVDPGLTFASRRLEEDLSASIGQERLLATLATLFGAIALLLSGVGLYGVSAHAITSRRAEIGIRIALGGQPVAVLLGMLRRIGLLVTTGAALGLAGAVWLSRFVAPLLYGLDANDPATLGASAAVLGAVAAIAAWIPAARATRLDPAQVLREL